MQIVIDIPNSLYANISKIQRGSIASKRILDCVRGGTTLPKGHGRLIDADELKKEYPHDTDWDYPVNTNCFVVESIDNSPTIIDAESEDKE